MKNALQGGQPFFYYPYMGVEVEQEPDTKKIQRYLGTLPFLHSMGLKILQGGAPFDS
jgi:hypothetical protein